VSASLFVCLFVRIVNPTISHFPPQSSMPLHVRDELLLRLLHLLHHRGIIPRSDGRCRPVDRHLRRRR
jgi:hypothetical protein